MKDQVGTDLFVDDIVDAEHLCPAAGDIVDK